MTILDKILGGIVAALAVTLAVFWIMNANLRADLATARANTMTLRSVNADLKADAEKQNAALIALKTANDARALMAQKAMKQAAAQAKRYAAQATALAGKPATGADDCASAKEILREYLGWQK